jgi:hypothetical protein
MNAYLTQPVRKKHGLDWQEEYILGLVDHGDVVRVSTVLDVSSEVMTQATAHKYLTQLVDKQLIKHNIGDDKRIKVLTLTPKGEKIIKELANVSAIPSLAMS